MSVERVHPNPAGHFVTARRSDGKTRTERAWRIPWNAKPAPEPETSRKDTRHDDHH